MSPLLHWFGRRLADYLSQPGRSAQIATSPHEHLEATLRPGDVLLVEGNTRISAAIKYLTQSTWSHAAFCIGDALGPPKPGEDARILIEADLREGVRAIPVGAYAGMHTRICRPVGLSQEDLRKVIGFTVSHIGGQYDLKNVFDLARYLLPTPPVPVRWRRRMLAFGSGDPTRAICSTLIAAAFEQVRYPILPEVTIEDTDDPAYHDHHHEVMHIRHYSLYTPRDFDISPYFEVVKPTLAQGFDFHRLAWADQAT